MMRGILHAWLPWLAILVACFVIAYALVRLSGARLKLGRLRRLHADQRGAVQSLSFVLTLPLFIMVVLFIVQVSQLMIGIVVVHYAAYAAARSASVWIPARLPLPERENCISSYAADADAPDQTPPVLDPESPNYGPGQGGMTNLVAPGGPKYNKIAMAAVVACVPICPSRSYGYSLPGDSAATAAALKAAYADLSPSSTANAKIPGRLENKLAYAMHNTAVEVRFFHKNEEPPLVTYDLGDAREEFCYNELGWQDQVTVKVKHDFLLLPGAGRLLAGFVFGYHSSGSSGSGTATSPGGSGSSGSSASAGCSGQSVASTMSGSDYLGPDPVPKLQLTDGHYTYPLEASITMGIEGEKLVIPYEYDQM